MLLNRAFGVAERGDDGIFLEQDSMPGDGGKLFVDVLKYLLVSYAASLRVVLRSEVYIMVDLLFRLAFHIMVSSALCLLPFGLGPALDEGPFPFVFPCRLHRGSSSTAGGAAGHPAWTVSPLWKQMLQRMVNLRELHDAVALTLHSEQEVYEMALTDAVAEVLGPAGKIMVSTEAFVLEDAFRHVMAAVVPGVVGCCRHVTIVGGGSHAGSMGSTDADADLRQLVGALTEEEWHVLTEEVQGAVSRLCTRAIDRSEAM